MAQGYETFLEQMRQGYEQRTGIPVDSASDVGLRFAVLAEQLAVLEGALEQAQAQSFAQTATGEALEMHAQQRGISRKQAVFARGTAVYSRSTAAQTDIPIPKGSFLTEPTGSIRYATEEEAVLQAGQTQVEVPVCSQVAGSAGNLAAGLLCVMVTPVQGIESVTNSQAILSGEDAESDDSLRQRLLDSYKQVTNGTNAAFYYNRAMSYSGVRSVKVLPRVNGVNTVGLVLHGPGVNKQLLAQVKEELGQVKEINVDLTVEQAQQSAVAIEIAIAVEDGYSFADVRLSCEQAVKELLEQQKIGQPLYLARLTQAALGCAGVANCKVVQPAQDQYPLEKQVFTCESCLVSEMEQKGEI